MLVGSSWSEEFVRQIGGSEMRHAYMADQVRTRIALQIRALRDQAERRWSQVELGRRAGKPQNVISRIENPDYGHLTLQTLFDMAAAFDLPLYIDFPEWEEWLGRMKDFSTHSLQKRSFDLERLVNSVRPQPESTPLPNDISLFIREYNLKTQIKRRDDKDIHRIIITTDPGNPLWVNGAANDDKEALAITAS